MKKNLLILLVLLPALWTSGWAQQYELQSPDGQLTLSISNTNGLHFSLRRGSEVLIPEVSLHMQLENGQVLGGGDRVTRTQKQTVDEEIRAVVAIKSARIPDQYNSLRLAFGRHYAVNFRAYNDAVAYRFETDFPDSITIRGEELHMALPAESRAVCAFNASWMNSYENLYADTLISRITDAKTIQLPMVIEPPAGGKLLITESDLWDYPGLYFRGGSGDTLKAVFPPAVRSERTNVRGSSGWDRNFIPESRYDYLARTSGARSFPWRIFAYASQDADLLNNQIVYKLAAPNRIKETSWIKPGQVAWDWWNHWNITGVDFRAGVNTRTYEYYIDFAARHHIPYIIMDEGWYSLGNMLERVPGIDVQAIADYGKKRGVGVILWCVWRTLDNQMEEAMDLFQQWGVRGIKVDFMDRDDQAVVDFYWRCAEAAARHHLLVDYHGAHKPTGIQRTYPNVVNFEGVPGLEQDKWTDKLATPSMAVTLPYIRMFAGPMDYTPGAMRNAQQKDFAPINDNPMSLGTRCQQLAMYVIYDAPLQMLADNPTAYEKEAESLKFITGVPTTWDETIPLAGKIGQYVALARKKGNTYFAAAMNNWTAREVTLDFSFLPSGNFHIEIFQDGINADRDGTDYKRTLKSIHSGDKLTIHLAPGGGWAARIDAD
jgi:alpha-glucosidase